MSKKNLLEEFRALHMDPMAVGLRQDAEESFCFCTPVGAEAVGSLGVDGVHFVQVPAVDRDMVFSVTPLPCGEHHIEPVAEDFETFLRLVLACGHASPLEQVSWLTKARFDELLAEDRASMYEEQIEALSTIQKTFDLKPCPAPFEHIKLLQKDFDYTTIPFSEEYYEVTGTEKPNGETVEHSEETAWTIEVRL